MCRVNSRDSSSTFSGADDRVERDYRLTCEVVRKTREAGGYGLGVANEEEEAYIESTGYSAASCSKVDESDTCTPAPVDDVSFKT